MLKRLKRLRQERGFTLVELMIVVSIIGILAAIAAPNYQWGIIRAKEAVLREDLYMIRSAIDQYAADQGKYPESLQALVEDKNKYLAKVPNDPFTKSAESWKVDPVPAPADGQQQPGIYDVHSGSTLVGTDGKPYSDW